jgi:8-oxo-dGTP diphosphatase
VRSAAAAALSARCSELPLSREKVHERRPYNAVEVAEATGRAQAIVPVVRKGDRVLVIKRGPGVIRPGYWCPPSGRMEPGETQEAAVVREVAEELGVTATPVRKVWECPTDGGDFTLHWWLVDVETYELRLNPTEVSDARWVTADEFLEMEPTFEGDREFFVRVWPSLS